MKINKIKRIAIIHNIISMLPILFILTMFILHLSLPDKTYSKEEQRYLGQWPSFHGQRVIDGSYGTKVESYFSDQFPFRKFWVQMKEVSDQVLFKK